MLTVEGHEWFIERLTSLPELELDAIVRDLSIHLRKNNLTHIFTNYFYDADQEVKIEQLEADVEELEKENRHLTEERDELKKTINQIRELV